MIWLTQKQTLRRRKECKDWEDPRRLRRGADGDLNERPHVGSQGSLPLGTSGRLSRTRLRVSQLSGEGAGCPHSHQLPSVTGEATLGGLNPSTSQPAFKQRTQVMESGW